MNIYTIIKISFFINYNITYFLTQDLQWLQFGYFFRIDF